VTEPGAVVPPLGIPLIEAALPLVANLLFGVFLHDEDMDLSLETGDDVVASLLF